MFTSDPDIKGPPSAGLKRFVRETLGCTCPEEVFEQVEIRSGPPLASGGSVRRIAIGGRLLIYLVEGAPVEDVHRGMTDWTISGRIDRDESGMNRFRLVIGVAGMSDLDAARIRDAFEAARDEHDDRIHLHVVESTALGDLHQGISP
jgi:hypothetical protein